MTDAEWIEVPFWDWPECPGLVPHYRTCAWCDEDGTDDVLAALPPRKFYWHAARGLSCCEYCLTEALADDPVIVEARP